MVAVDVDDGDQALDAGPAAGEAVPEEEAQQLLLRRVEPEARREEWIGSGSSHRRFHASNSCCKYDDSFLWNGETETICFAVLFILEKKTWFLLASATAIALTLLHVMYL